ncbi:solute carrier family 43 member 3-like [Salarias fasciatus]|uniref:Solute carrier family 43 member 3-like n=1 Tax=Salarias fasciatus TaxID=181472 RepID=A0A672I148_SALFA|nr:solute carrier family 43 member 3-like [Salarias fasciatus]
MSAGQKVQHWLTLLSGLVEALFFTGISFGWASLVFVLKTEGYFAGHCVNSTAEATEELSIHTDCIDQDEHLSQVMSVACICNTVTRFPIGYFFDRCGTTVMRLIAISLYLTGTLLITLSSVETSVLLYPALSCLIISGSILYITNVQVGNLFDSFRSTIITIYNGAFDSSALVFLIVKLLHERGVPLHSLFLSLAFNGVFLVLRTFLLMPRGHIPYPLPEKYTYGVKCSGCNRGTEGGKNEKKDEEQEDERKHKKEGNEEAGISSLHLLQNPTNKPKGQEAAFQSCVLSWLFLWHLVWVVIIIFCHYIFFSTLNPTLTRLADNDKTLVSHYTNAFAFTQLCSLLFAPINGLIMDRHKHRTLAPGESKREADLRLSCLALFLTSLQCFLFCVCFTCPVLPLQYLTFILQVVCSGFFYGGHQAFVSIAFPMPHFGKISGVAMSVSAVALFLQFPILHFIQQQLHGDSLYVKVGVTLVSLLTFIHPLHVYLHSRKLTSQRKTEQEVQEQNLTSSHTDCTC